MTGHATIFFPDLVHHAERLLADGLSLRVVPLPAELARSEGTWKGAPVAIETTAYAGGPVQLARFARVWQPGARPGERLEIGNVLALGRPELGLPILGADVVCMGPRGRMLAADLSPVVPPGEARERQLAALGARAAARARITPGGELPDWCARFFSPHALFVRPREDEVPAAVAELESFWLSFRELAAAARPCEALPASRSAAIQAEYLAAHRTDDKGLGMLARMFGDAWARRYVAEVLFPDALRS